MKIQVNSDKNITVDRTVISFVRTEVGRLLVRYKSQLTRVEVYLSDANSHKFGTHDKRCVVEVRPAGRNPMVATIDSGSVRSAIQGSLAKMQRALERYLGRSRNNLRTLRQNTRTVVSAVSQNTRVTKMATICPHSALPWAGN